MTLLEKNIELIKKIVLEGDSRFIDLTPLTARVHLKLPREISSVCSHVELSNFILGHCVEWGISIQDGQRLLMTENVIEKSGANDIVVECIADDIKLVSNSHLIDSIIEQCGFVNAHDISTGDIVILTKDRAGQLHKAGTSAWPDLDLDTDLDMQE